MKHVQHYSARKTTSSKSQTTSSNQPIRHQLTLLEVYRRLSRRECEVLEKIVKGKTNLEIADELFISPKTVESHITNIGKTLDCSGKGRLRKRLNCLL